MQTDNVQAWTGQEAESRKAVLNMRLPGGPHNVVTRQAGEIVRALFAARETAACRIAALTPRQREILDMLLAGCSSKTIAWKIGINQRTVENHRASIMKKTGAKSMPALVRLAVAADWNGIDQTVGDRVVQASWPIRDRRRVVPTARAI
jgi:DNA-binding CsgD family transcriptional regulator